MAKLKSDNQPFYVSVFTTDAIHSIDHGQLTLFRQRLSNSIEKCISSNSGIILQTAPSIYKGKFKTATDAIFAAMSIKRKSKYNLGSINKEISDIELMVYGTSEIEMDSDMDWWISKFVPETIVSTPGVKESFYKENKSLKLDQDTILLLKKSDLLLLKSIFKVLEFHYTKETFDVQSLCKQLKLPYSKVYSVLTRLTNKNPSYIIRNYRLLKSLAFLENGSVQIEKISTKVGFSNASYFSKSFKERFGITPSELRKMLY